MSDAIRRGLNAKEEYDRLVRLGKIFRAHGVMPLDPDIAALDIRDYYRDEIQRFRLIFFGNGYPNDGSFESPLPAINLLDFVRRILHVKEATGLDIPELNTIPIEYAAYANEVLRSTGTLAMFEPFVRDAMNTCRTFDQLKATLEPQFLERIMNNQYPTLVGVEALSIYCTNYWELPALTDVMRFYTGVAFLESLYSGLRRHISVSGIPDLLHKDLYLMYSELLVKLLQPLVEARFGGDSYIFGAKEIQAALNERIRDLDNQR